MLFFLILSYGSWALTILLAVKHDRNIIAWAIAGAFLGVFALIAMLISLSRRGELRRSKNVSENEAY